MSHAKRRPPGRHRNERFKVDLKKPLDNPRNPTAEQNSIPCQCKTHLTIQYISSTRDLCSNTAFLVPTADQPQADPQEFPSLQIQLAISTSLSLDSMHYNPSQATLFSGSIVWPGSTFRSRPITIHILHARPYYWSLDGPGLKWFLEASTTRGGVGTHDLLDGFATLPMRICECHVRSVTEAAVSHYTPHW